MCIRDRFLGNRGDWGGAVYVAGGTARIEDSRLVESTAQGGGAVFIAAGTLDLVGSEISTNEAGVGGGLFIGPAAEAQTDRTTITGNTARQGGGAYVQGTFHSINTVSVSYTHLNKWY